MSTSNTTRRRLSPEQRREQLVRTAMRLLAADGSNAVTFDAVASAAGVTRNLLYHYFPDGVGALRLAVADCAGHDLTDGWSTDRELSLDERRDRNFEAMTAHAAGPTDAWVVNRLSHLSTDPEIRETADRYRRRIVDAMSLNAFDTTEPTPVQRAALESYLAFAEVLLDATRMRALPAEVSADVLREMLEATVEATRGR